MSNRILCFDGTAKDSASSRVGSRSLREDHVLKDLIRQMAAANVTWGEERIANELKLKLCILVSPRTAEWTLQQIREAVPGDHAYKYVIHDRNSIFSRQLDGP